MTIKITANEKGNPPGKLADAEIHFDDEAPRTDAGLIQHLRDVGEPTAAGRLAELSRYNETLAGLKLIGFSIWERRTGNRAIGCTESNGRNVTFPARQYSVNGERRSFALLRPIADTSAQERIRLMILDAYAAYESGDGDGMQKANTDGPWFDHATRNPRESV